MASRRHPVTRRDFLRLSAVGLSSYPLAFVAGCAPTAPAPAPTKPAAAPTPAAQATEAPKPAAPVVTQAPAAAAAKDAITFRIGHAESLGSPTNDAFERWIKILDERSGGRLKAQHFPAGQLGNYTQIIEGNRLGTIEISMGGPDTEAKVAPIVAALALGYVFKDEQHVDRVLQGPIGERVSEECKAKTGVEFIAYGEEGFRHVLSKRPVRTLADLKGMKIRVPETPIGLRTFQLLGASPTPVAFNEVYNALQTGVVEATEASLFAIQGFKYHEPAGHLTLSGHWFNPKPVRVNAKWLAGLPSDLQTLLRQTAQEVMAEERADARKRATDVLQQLRGQGTQVYELPDKEEWIRATAPQHSEYAKEFPEAARVLEEVQALG